MTNETTYGILHFRICVCGRDARCQRDLKEPDR
nr:MAG TPA: hypothetical protein [Caudoviricetes sp.]